MTDPVKIIVGEGDITEVNVPEYNLIQTGGGGGGGSDGATFFPEVSEEGVISWTNDGGYDNPEPVNIKGPQGDAGQGIAAGGTTGQVLAKTSNADYATGWATLTAAPVQSVNGQTGAVVLSASDVSAGTYSKPSGGIPKTDLASAVQTSLGLADSALQAVPSTYRTAAAQDAIDAEARSKVFKNIEGTARGSIAASTNSSITVDISVPTGYRIFAINTIGFNGTNSDYLALRGFTVLSSNNQVTIKMRSMATQSTISYTISVWVTCAKSDLF